MVESKEVALFVVGQDNGWRNWFAVMNKQLLPFESKNGNYGCEATQVLVLSNYYADKNYLMKIQMNMEISDFKGFIHHF